MGHADSEFEPHRRADTRQYVSASPGVGKTHLAVALGLKAIEAGYRVLFSTAANLIATLTKAHGEGRLDEKLKVYTTSRLLIIDLCVVRGYVE